MGCVASGPAGDERARQRLADQTHFRPGQIRVLREVFSKVSRSLDGDGTIDADEFQLALFGREASGGTTRDLFSDRIFACFDSARDGRLTFEEFVKGLSVFHPQATRDEKTEFAFRVYDLRGTGAIEREDVREMLEAVLRQSKAMTLTKEMMEAVLNKTFEDCDLTKDGVISMKEFKTLVEKNEKIIANMTMPSLERLTKVYPDFLFTAVGSMR
jgi:serine/threonine-protein phosphatase 2B regulatory subunit